MLDILWNHLSICSLEKPLFVDFISHLNSRIYIHKNLLQTGIALNVKWNKLATHEFMSPQIRTFLLSGNIDDHELKWFHSKRKMNQFFFKGIGICRSWSSNRQLHACIKSRFVLATTSLTFNIFILIVISIVLIGYNW